MTRHKVTLTRKDAVTLAEGLLALRLPHREVNDSWYSCPRSEEGCIDESAGAGCNCGADAHNALIERLLDITGTVR